MNTTAGVIKMVKKKRSCLMCGNMFLSEGSHNRRCKSCEKHVILRKKDYLASPYIHKVSHKNELDTFGSSYAIGSKD